MKIFLSISILLFVFPCSAMNREIAWIEAGVLPASGFRNPGAAGSSKDVALRYYDCNFSLPRVLSKKGERLTLLTPGIGFRLLHGDRDESTGGGQNFFSLRFSLNLLQMLSTGWGISVYNNIKFNTDFEQPEKVSIRDTSYNGGFIFMRFFSRELMLGFGFGYISLTGDRMLSPLLLCNWKPHPKLKLDFVLPSSFTLSWLVSGKIRTGLKVFLEGDQFNLTEQGAVYHGLLKRSVVQAGIFFKYRMRGPLFFTTFFGRTLYRRFEVYDSSDTRIWDNSLEDGWVFRFRLSLDFS